jgi:hypothetical protein
LRAGWSQVSIQRREVKLTKTKTSSLRIGLPAIWRSRATGGGAAAAVKESATQNDKKVRYDIQRTGCDHIGFVRNRTPVNSFYHQRRWFELIFTGAGLRQSRNRWTWFAYDLLKNSKMALYSVHIRKHRHDLHNEYVFIELRGR